MSITDSCTLFSDSPESTRKAGASLAHTLYEFPLTILLSGELGTGKTTFLKGFAEALGVKEDVVSPTFALEQRYQTTSDKEFIHLDLYRLTPSQARELITSSEETAGIRCIEWPERLEADLQSLFPHHISIVFTEVEHGRRLQFSFDDVPLPSREQILAWRKELCLPANVSAHCDAVAAACARFAKLFQERNHLVRHTTLIRAAEAHDLLRAIDFTAQTGPAHFRPTQEQEQCWAKWKKHFPGIRHEEAAARFLTEHGFEALASIVSVHGLTLPSASRATIEQKLLFYADKRVMEDTFVSLNERLEDFTKRYGNAPDHLRSTEWYAQAQALEKELFPEGAPTE